MQDGLHLGPRARLFFRRLETMARRAPDDPKSLEGDGRSRGRARVLVKRERLREQRPANLLARLDRGREEPPAAVARDAALACGRRARLAANGRDARGRSLLSVRAGHRGRALVTTAAANEPTAMRCPSSAHSTPG